MHKSISIAIIVMLAFSACSTPHTSRKYNPNDKYWWADGETKKILEMNPTERGEYFEQISKQADEKNAKQQVLYPDYPKVGTTYLSFSTDHGFQVSYYENTSRSWLWYGGNPVSLPAQWKTETLETEHSNIDQICWKYGGYTYNPSTKKSGGEFNCIAIRISQDLLVSSLEGDIFNLASGSVPYERKKCDAPSEFVLNKDSSLFGNIITDCVTEDD